MVLLSVLLHGGCDRLICCFAAWRPSLSRCLFCCLWGYCGTSCCFVRGSCHRGFHCRFVAIGFASRYMCSLL